MLAHFAPVRCVSRHPARGEARNSGIVMLHTQTRMQPIVKSLFGDIRRSRQGAGGFPPQRSEGRATMRRSTSITLVCGLFLLSSLPAAAQSTPNPAMTTPDQVAWQFFIQVNSRASGSNALVETWASDTDTFKPTPQFPTTATPMALREPVVPALGRQALQKGGRLLPAIPPGRGFL